MLGRSHCFLGITSSFALCLKCEKESFSRNGLSFIRKGVFVVVFFFSAKMSLISVLPCLSEYEKALLLRKGLKVMKRDIYCMKKEFDSRPAT